MLLDHMHSIYTDPKIIELVNNSFRNLIVQWKKECVEEIVEDYPYGCNDELFSLRITHMEIHPCITPYYKRDYKYRLDIYCKVSYDSEDRYNYILKIFDNYDIWDDVFYGIRPEEDN